MLPRAEISTSLTQPTTGALNAPPKKGNRDHAERLIELAVQAGIPTGRPIFVIGDGRSDHFLFRSLERVRRKYPDMPQPKGLFLRNPSLEVFETNSNDCQYFASWKEMCGVLLKGETALGGGFAIVDVDRTVILPRGQMDQAYNEVRARSLNNLSHMFTISEAAQSEAASIGDIANELEGSLCYYRDQGDQLCHENFEVIALTAMLKVMGLISDLDICRALPPDEELLDILKLCRNEVKTGNWRARLDRHIVGSYKHWNSDMAVDLIMAAIDAIEEGSPSLCPMFRNIECAELLAAKEHCPRTFFNHGLMEALLGSSIQHIIFVSDRPIMSVYDGENFVLDFI